MNMLRDVNLNFEMEKMAAEITADATDLPGAIALINALKATHNANIEKMNTNLLMLNEFFNDLRRMG